MGRCRAAVLVLALLTGALVASPARAQSPGGLLTVMSLVDVDSLDPGYWYYEYDYMALGQTTQRWLYAWEPDKTAPTPDVAAALPQTSPDGKTVTIPIRPGIRYSAPLAGRTVTAADVAYAITRDLIPRTGNGYAPAYYRTIVGARSIIAGRTQKLRGLETPDALTLVIHLTRPTGSISTAQSLALPGTAPVPADYAKRYDRGSESSYGAHQVFTGPYKIASYRAGRRIDLVRNPDWNGRDTGDFRPAYLDEINFLGGRDITVATRDVLSGSHEIAGDFNAPAGTAGATGVSAGSVRFIALNTKVRPFGRLNVRRAVAAAIDKVALINSRGGPSIGSVATHVIPPGIPGFDEAGGAAGPPLDFTRNPRGDLKLARSYLRKAGYRGGRYRGRPLLFVGDEQPPASRTAAEVARQLRRLGFRLRVRRVSHPTMLSRYCSRPKAAVAICPSLGWGKDFFDAESMLDPVFNGANIASSNNSNYAQVNDPRIDAELDRAGRLTDPAARARLYADVDRRVVSGAYVIPWVWDNDLLVRSSDVRGVVSAFNGTWDLTYTSIG
jgi:peptide/nickel transport system substrate-binding protein